MESIDGCLLALTLGATFVARSFSGDKAQLVPILKAGLAHSGFAFIDVISPCVTFNDHEGSTKSYAYTREHNARSGRRTSCPGEEIKPSPTRQLPQLAEPPELVRLRKVEQDYDARIATRLRLNPRAARRAV